MTVKITTPLSITEEISSFCSEISPDAQPVFVAVDDVRNSEASQCYYDVKERVDEDGGEQLFGWIIWEAEGLFLEAEHHSIWKKPNGDLVDVAIKPDGEQRILFLEDSSVPFHFNKPKRWDNHRRAVCDLPEVRRFLETARARGMFTVRNSRSKGRYWEVSGDEKIRRRFARLERDFAEAQRDLFLAVKASAQK